MPGNRSPLLSLQAETTFYNTNFEIMFGKLKLPGPGHEDEPDRKMDEVFCSPQFCNLHLDRSEGKIYRVKSFWIVITVESAGTLVLTCIDSIPADFSGSTSV